MRFVNEMAIFSTILWYTNDILKYYGNIFFEQRKSLLVFLPKEKKIDIINKKEFKFEMTLESNLNKNVKIEENIIINDIVHKNLNSDFINKINYTDVIYNDNVKCYNNNLEEVRNESFVGNYNNNFFDEKNNNFEKNDSYIESLVDCDNCFDNIDLNKTKDFSRNEVEKKDNVIYEFEFK